MDCSDHTSDNGSKPLSTVGDRVPETQAAVFKIGYVAKQYQVTLRTLRFYECSGLLQPKRKGLTRLYSVHDCHRLEMILRGRQLGFSLAEIHDLIQTRDDSVKVTDIESALGPAQIIMQIQNLERQREEIDKAISALRNAHRKMHECDPAGHFDSRPSTS